MSVRSRVKLPADPSEAMAEALRALLVERRGDGNLHLPTCQVGLFLCGDDPMACGGKCLLVRTALERWESSR